MKMQNNNQTEANWLRRLVGKLFPSQRKPRTFKTGGCWGDKIDVIDWGNRKVVGWKYDQPMVGDRLLIEMQSGKTLECEFTDVEYVPDPPDMFWATVRPIDYVSK